MSDDAPQVGTDGGRDGGPRLSRRALLTGTAATAAGLAALGVAARGGDAAAATAAVAFHGTHQAGVTTPAQDRLVFAAFDVATSSRRALRDLLAAWTTASVRLTEGRLVAPTAPAWEPPSDTGEAVGLGPASLTLTVGFGPSLFDRVEGLAARRPEALADLPPFPGDDLDPARSGGDLCVQACADDEQVAFHAVRNLARLGLGTVALRWLQVGFSRTSSTTTSQTTPRNLLGFKDGTANLKADEPAALERYVWVPTGTDQPWLAGGTYLVARRIRTHLEDWASIPLEAQEQAIGRFKGSGAPLTGTREDDPIDLRATGARGIPIIPLGAHVRVASASTNGGARLLRRGYSFADGVDARTGELDAGLFFVCFQQDPATGFVRIQSNLAINDTLREYVTHTSSAVFACPPGTRAGGYLGETLFRD